MRLQTIVAVAIVAAAGTYLVVGRSAPVAFPDEPGPSIEFGRSEAIEAGRGEGIIVHVSGCVASPGIVELTVGARVAAAIAAAGGALRCADLGAVNLAAEVSDGGQLVVPALGAATAGTVAPSDPDDGRIRLNTATTSQLEALPGIGPVLAERIIRYRDEHGAFAEIEDLLDVAGIGEAKLRELRDLVDL